MNKIMLAMVMSTLSTAVWAVDYVDTAKVISSTPIYERISEPKQECWNETITTPGYTSGTAPVEERSLGGAIVGGVVGGVIGHQVGKGSGNTAATVAGTIAGAIIGDRVANQPGTQAPASQAPQSRQERHCRQVESFRDVIRGYNVTYRYKGQDVTTKLPYEPGNTVRVGISVLEDDGGDVRDHRGSEDRLRRSKDHRYDD